MSIIEATRQEELQSDSTWKAIFTQGKPRFFQRLVLSAFVMSMYQLTGVNLITYYVYVLTFTELRKDRLLVTLRILLAFY